MLRLNQFNHHHIKGVAILGVFLFAMSGSIVQGIIPEEPQLLMLAGEAQFKNGAWQNIGTAGDEIPGGADLGKGTPKLEKGEEFYEPGGPAPTAFKTTDINQMFAAPAGFTPNLHLENWSFEVIMKRNGPMKGAEHQVMGFHSTKDGKAFATGAQWIMIGFTNWIFGPDVDDVWIYLLGANTVYDKRKNHHDVGLTVGTRWVHIIYTYDDAKKQVKQYLDGEFIGNLGFPEQDFDKGADMNFNAIFCQVLGEEHRNMNGSVHLVRIYDFTMDAKQADSNFQHPFAVDPGRKKVTTTWGRVKTQY